MYIIIYIYQISSHKNHDNIHITSSMISLDFIQKHGRPRAPCTSKDRMGQMIRSTTSSRIRPPSSLCSRSAQRCAAEVQL